MNKRRTIWTGSAIALALLFGSLFAYVDGQVLRRCVFTKRDTLHFMRFGSGTFGIAGDDGVSYMARADGPIRTRWRFAGVEYWGASLKRRPAWNLWVPYWPLLIMLGVPPLVWIAGTIRRGVRYSCSDDHVACPECGYDLTGNVSGRCPECGAATDRVHLTVGPPVVPTGVGWRERLRVARRTRVGHGAVLCAFTMLLWAASYLPIQPICADRFASGFRGGVFTAIWDVRPGRAEIRHPAAAFVVHGAWSYWNPSYAPEIHLGAGAGEVSIPLWMPLVVLAMLTLEAWYRGRLRNAPRGARSSC